MGVGRWMSVFLGRVMNGELICHFILFILFFW